MIKFKTLIATFVIGILAQISYNQAGPIEVIYTGNTCDCPKNLNYLVHVPPPAVSNEYKKAEYGYKLDVPVEGKAEVTYKFDFTVLEPKTPPTYEEPKLNLFAKIDRMTAHKKDCYTPTAESNCDTYGCRSCDASRYVSPEESVIRYTRNSSKQSKSVRDYKEPATTQIMAVFFEPLQQTESGVIKSRNKRDLSRIFMRPRKNEKRSERIVKQYNKRLTDQVSNANIFRETPKASESRSSLSPSCSGIRPLHTQIKNFLNLPHRLRNRRDIKGEYDLIEKEREEMDLTLPEIIQYMPETLDPNFKRGTCHLGQLCQDSKLSTDSSSTESTSKNEKTTTSTMTAIEENIQDNTNDEENINNNNTNVEDMETDNALSSTHTKRNAAVYNKACPKVFRYNNPTPRPSYSYEPLTNYQAISPKTPYGLDPVPQLYVGAPYKTYALADPGKAPLVRLAYGSANGNYLTNSQLDQVITDIVNKHADFIETASHQNGGLVDPITEQEHQNKLFLKQLFSGNLYSPFNEGQLFNPHANIPYYQVPLPPLVY